MLTSYAMQCSQPADGTDPVSTVVNHEPWL